MAFPNQVNIYQAPAVAGDFASNNNNKFSQLAGQGGFVSGPNGVTVGNFCWADYQSGIVTSSGYGLVAGFVHRQQQANITTFLAETGVTITPGQEMGVMSSGDFWVVNNSTAAVVPGVSAVVKVYANFATGAATYFGATGSPPTGFTGTGSIASNTATFTASIAIPPTPSNAPGTMTVSAVSSGTLSVGGTLTGLTSVVAGTTIVKQLTATNAGTLGQGGTYEVSIPQTVVSSTGTATNGLLTVTVASTGTLAIGDVLSGTGITTNTAVTQLGTGTGGTGTYYVNYSQSASSTAVTATGAVETKWHLLSAGQVGELVMISSTAQG